MDIILRRVYNFGGVSISLSLVYELATEIVPRIIAAIQKKFSFQPSPLPHANLLAQVQLWSSVWVHPRFVSQGDPNWITVKFSGLLYIRCLVNKNKSISPSQCSSVGWSYVPYSEWPQIWFLKWAHTQVVGSILIWGANGSNWLMFLFQMGIFLCLSLSLPSLSKKISKKVERYPQLKI